MFINTLNYGPFLLVRVVKCRRLDIEYMIDTCSLMKTCAQPRLGYAIANMNQTTKKLFVDVMERVISIIWIGLLYVRWVAYK
jgi:hypothetical protein